MVERGDYGLDIGSDMRDQRKRCGGGTRISVWRGIANICLITCSAASTATECPHGGQRQSGLKMTTANQEQSTAASHEL